MRAWFLGKFTVLCIAVYYGAFAVLAGMDDPVALQAARRQLSLLPHRASVLGARLAHWRWFGAQGRFALIINSDDGLRHLRNVREYSRHLRTVYGVPEENILILCTISCDKRFAPATKAGFAAALEELRRRAKGNDVLFLYTTGHGGRDDEESWLALEDDGRLTEGEFAEGVFALPVGHIHYYGDQCYSGAFVWRIQSRNDREVVAMSATGPYTTCSCQLFTPYYLKAFDADPANVSEWEAIKAAERHENQAYADPDGDPDPSSPPFYFNSGPKDWDTTLRQRAYEPT